MACCIFLTRPPQRISLCSHSLAHPPSPPAPQAALTSLRFNRSGSLLASGGNDTDVVVWDVLSEAGLFRLRGHTDAVTDVAWLEAAPSPPAPGGEGATPGAAAAAAAVPSSDACGWLLSASKDTHLRVWDVAARRCVQTVTGHRGEVWSLDVSPCGRRVATGAADSQLRLFAVARPGDASLSGVAAATAADALLSEKSRVLVPLGAMQRPGADRVSRLRFDPTGRFIAVAPAGKLVEVWNVHGEAEAARRAKRRRKRRREKDAPHADAAAAAAAAEANGELPLPAPLPDDDGGGGAGGSAAAATAAAAAAIAEEAGPRASDELSLACTLPLRHKAVGLSWAPRVPRAGAPTHTSSAAASASAAARAPQSSPPSFALSLSCNSVEVYALSATAAGGGDASKESGGGRIEAVKRSEVAQAGHRADIRALALSPDDSMLLSASHAGVKARRFGPILLPNSLVSHLFFFSLRIFSPAHVLPPSAIAAPRGATVSEGRARATTFVGWACVTPALLYQTRDGLSPPPSAVPGDDIPPPPLHPPTFRSHYHFLPLNLSPQSPPPFPQIWNPSTGACLRSVAGGYGLCASFAPGGRHAVVGTKGGALEFFDVAAAARTRALPAHAGPVWCLSLTPDGTGLATGGGDKELRLWKWSVAVPEADAEAEAEAAGKGGDAGEGEGGAAPRAPPAKTLSATHVRTLRLTDDVLACCFTPNGGKLIAVALLDCTLRVFHTDSLQLHLTLYGHKLPAVCLAVSGDGSVLASGGADKNVRLWGLDFGDCHASLRAHDDAVTALAFVPKTHQLFSAGRDKLVKLWDADSFEPLLTLPGHSAEVWALAVSSGGEFLASSGRDRSIRTWSKTEEPFFVDEERERRLESMFEQGLEDGPEWGGSKNGDGKKTEAPGEGAEGLAGRRSVATLSAAEALVDALESCEAEEARLAEHAAEAEQARGGPCSIFPYFPPFFFPFPPPSPRCSSDEPTFSGGTAAAGCAVTNTTLIFFRRDDDSTSFSPTSVSLHFSHLSRVCTPPFFPQATAAGGKPPPFVPNPLLLGASPQQHVLIALLAVRRSDVEHALLLLPFTHALRLASLLPSFLSRRSPHAEAAASAAVVLLRLHQRQFAASGATCRGPLRALRAAVRARLTEARDDVGFVLAGAQAVMRLQAADSMADDVAD